MVWLWGKMKKKYIIIYVLTLSVMCIYTMCNRTSESSSESRVDTVMRSHRFTIHNYSLAKGRGIGKSISSMIFTVGQHDWAIWCYLDGDKEEYSDYISAFLRFHPKSNKKARVKYSLSLLDHSTGSPVHVRENESVRLFSSTDCEWGWVSFIKRDQFEASECLRGDSFTTICNVTVIKEP